MSWFNDRRLRKLEERMDDDKARFIKSSNEFYEFVRDIKQKEAIAESFLHPPVEEATEIKPPKQPKEKKKSKKELEKEMDLDL